jgi:DedD protein
MSASYTGETTMNEAAFREVERSSERSADLSAERAPWRDKIEVRLDNRQVFFLFFGSALCACMLFVLGVIVGKRLESRGRAAIPEVQDPLAVLDRVSTPGSGATSASVPAESALTFPKALIGSPSRAHGTPLALPRAAAVVAPKAPLPVAPKAVPVVAPKAPPAVAPKAPPATASKTTAVASAKPAARSPSAWTSAAAIPPAAIAAVAPPAPAFASAAAKGKFTLVLSSFPDRSEADAFARRFAGQGAYVAVADSPGKHGIYSVRVGSYGSSQEAAVAKTAFEKQTNTIAYVAGR